MHTERELPAIRTELGLFQRATFGNGGPRLSSVSSRDAALASAIRRVPMIKSGALLWNALRWWSKYRNGIGGSGAIVGSSDSDQLRSRSVLIRDREAYRVPCWCHPVHLQRFQLSRLKPSPLACKHLRREQVC